MNNFQVEEESEGEEDVEAITKACEEVASPTRAYLKAVSVPKKKPLRKRKKTTLDDGNTYWVTC